MQTLTHQNPSHVSPPFAVERSVRIAFFIRELMMNAMSCDPENRSTFERQSCANRQEIFHPLRSFISAMSKQAVVAHAYAETAGNPPQETGDEKCLPSKEEQRCDCAYVKGPHKYSCDPIDFVVLAIAFERFYFHVVSPGFGY